MILIFFSESEKAKEDSRKLTKRDREAQERKNLKIQRKQCVAEDILKVKIWPRFLFLKSFCWVFNRGPGKKGSYSGENWMVWFRRASQAAHLPLRMGIMGWWSSEQWVPGSAQKVCNSIFWSEGWSEHDGSVSVFDFRHVALLQACSINFAFGSGYRTSDVSHPSMFEVWIFGGRRLLRAVHQMEVPELPRRRLLRKVLQQENKPA